jgi:GT2 family glycosyltransferase
VRVSVLIVGYRNLRHLDACIGGAIRAMDGLDSEILFIDCSNDGSAEFVRERFPGVRVLPHAGNLGFGRGNNHLAREAHGDYVLLLNPDTVPRSDEITRLVRFADAHPAAGACGGRCVFPSGEHDLGSHQPMLDVPGMVLTALGLARLRRGALPLDASAPQRVEVISGAFMLVRRALWERLGGFDELFFMYTEEVDLCKRIADAGFELWADPSIVMIHDAGSGDPDNPRKRLQLLRGNATFFRKHSAPLAATIGCGAMLANEWIRLAYARTVLRVLRPARARSLGERCAHAVRHRAEWWMGWPPGMRFD